MLSNPGTNPTKKKNKDIRVNFSAFLLVLPALVFLIVTTQAPFIMTVYYSFFKWNLTIPGERPFVGLSNYLPCSRKARICM